MVKRAVQAASARGAAVGSTLYLQISDVDSEVGECDPLTLLKRFKVGRQFISHFPVKLCLRHATWRCNVSAQTYGDVFYNHVEKLTHRVATCIKEVYRPIAVACSHCIFYGDNSN